MQSLILLSDIRESNHIIAQAFINGESYELYEDDIFGDEEKGILVNLTKGTCYFTWESIHDTVKNINDYTEHKLIVG